ncbi:serine/threonine-protein kinase PLK4 [Drosophila novamexicana]|uniref:serine/threonine-protein kinase PLK4 n=1 Tax=Drosophila novamexicana TaxID=47314 RepID=UPI0011E5B1B7|nr:serine/threonine-protein kinase PLK4 [Drosophila novamexicana]
MLPFRNYGETIDEYEVQHLLGKGGFACVYKAKCLRSHQNVAIKMIDKKLIQGSGLSNRVRQEVEIHSRLKHPSVLQLYTFFQDANYVYLILELADNGELHRYMNQQMKRPFTEEEASSILRQVVDGLLYLHSHNIMHRDISMSNLLLSKDMHVKIADFGLATQLKRPDERHMTMCGTPNYISPEVVSHQSHGLPADLWSVGCMLYTLLVGRPPFDTDAVQSTLNKVVHSDYTIPSHLSYEARDLIDKLLRKNPHERISLEQVLRHPFMVKAGGSAISYTTSGTSDGYGQSIVSGDSGIVTFASNDSKNSRRLRSVEQQSTPQMMPQIHEEYGYYQEHRQQYAPHAAYRQSTAETLDSTEMDWQRMGQNTQKANFLVHSTPAASVPAAVIRKAGKHNTEHISVPPLNTLRLQPTRYKTKNAIMSIVANGEVVIEFIKSKSKMNEDRIIDICRISGDGRRIIIHQPDPGRGLPIREQASETHSSGTDNVYNYDNLPSKHWKKYVYAARFVGLVKSKTPKVTYFSTLAKCHLMENMADFEMNYFSGAKLTKSPSEGIKVLDNHGVQLLDQSSSEAKRLIEHSNECFAHCLSICNALELAQTGSNTCFPVTIGRRPIVEVLPSHRPEGLRDTTNFAYSTPKSQQGSINFSISTISSMRSGSDNIGSQLLAAQQNVPIKRLNVPGVGTATELSHGIVQVQFLDGSVISVIPEAQGGGITYTQSNGVSTHFPDHDDLPLSVRDRLSQLPQVQMKLRCAPLISSKKFDCNAMNAKSTASAPWYNRMLI